MWGPMLSAELMGETNMLDYLRIRVNAHLAKMEERGASAVEYGLLIAGIAAVIVVAVITLGPVVKEAFDGTKTEICKSSAVSSC